MCGMRSCRVRLSQEISIYNKSFEPKLQPTCEYFSLWGQQKLNALGQKHAWNIHVYKTARIRGTSSKGCHILLLLQACTTK